jgi:hypothetical protein
MKQKAIIWFFILKDIFAIAIITEVEFIYKAYIFCFIYSKKYRKYFTKGKISFCDDPRSERLLIHNLTKHYRLHVEGKTIDFMWILVLTFSHYKSELFVNLV